MTYPGALNNGAGATAEITNRSGGAVSLSGAIADSNDAGGGISLSGNTGGSTTFSGATKTLNTTTGTAVSFSASAKPTSRCQFWPLQPVPPMCRSIWMALEPSKRSIR